MSQVTESQMLKRYGKAVVYMTTGGMEHLIEKEGGVCTGFSIRAALGDALLVIRAEFDGLPMVAFQGGATGAGALYKAHDNLRNGGLTWKPDKFRK